MRARLVVLLLLALAAGCQPSGGPAGGASATQTAVAASEQIGAPDASLPMDLPALLERGGQVAKEWQDDPVLSEVQVDVDQAGAWSRVRLVYLAPDADRFLQLTEEGGHFSQQRPSLASLQIQSVPAAGLDQLPPFPDDALPPQELATSPAVANCGVEGAATVLYATGAPVAWDGAQWSTPPQWQGLVTNESGAGARVNLATGAGDGCLDAENS